MRIFTTKLFRKFARDSHIPEAACCQAVREVNAGIVHARLGGNVFKQRIAREGQGKSGGFRTILCLKAGEKAFFVYKFAKNVQDNIERQDLAGLKMLAKELLNYDDQKLSLGLEDGELYEICREALS